jgi:hypothetical protein
MMPWGAAPRRPYHLVASRERGDGGGIRGLFVFVPEYSTEQAFSYVSFPWPTESRKSPA